MDWEFLARFVGQYTVLFGGGTVAIAYFLPESISPYALLASIAVGLFLFGRAALASGGAGQMSGGTPAGSAHALASGSDGILSARPDDAPLGAGLLFYAIGLVVFGIAALSTLM